MLIVVEALHRSAAAEVLRLLVAVSDESAAIWSAPAKTAVLTGSTPRLEF